MTAGSRGLATSKSESYILSAKQKSGARLPKLKPQTAIHDKTSSNPKCRGRQELRLPPPGGHQKAA